MSDPQGWKISLTGLEHLVGSRKWRKATVKIERNTAPWFIGIDPINNQKISPRP